MMMMSGFVERVIKVLRRAADQPNRWAFRCRANVRRERVAVRRAAGKLFQMTGPATAKLLIPSVVAVLGTDSIPVRMDLIKVHLWEGSSSRVTTGRGRVCDSASLRVVVVCVCDAVFDDMWSRRPAASRQLSSVVRSSRRRQLV